VNTPPGLDPGIEHAVRLLNLHGIYTVESCQGGPGHSYPEPTVRFNGEYAEGFRALAVALANGLKVSELRRTYWMQKEGIAAELHGPWWELVFTPTTGQ
jgi:hypothetical protein